MKDRSVVNYLTKCVVIYFWYLLELRPFQVYHGDAYRIAL